MPEYRVAANYTYIATVDAPNEEAALAGILDLDTTSMDLYEISPIEATLVYEEDDDPVCKCGVYRSEHALCGCPDGFERA